MPDNKKTGFYLEASYPIGPEGVQRSAEKTIENAVGRSADDTGAGYKMYRDLGWTFSTMEEAKKAQEKIRAIGDASIVTSVVSLDNASARMLQGAVNMAEEDTGVMEAEEGMGTAEEFVVVDPEALVKELAELLGTDATIEAVLEAIIRLKELVSGGAAGEESIEPAGEVEALRRHVNSLITEKAQSRIDAWLKQGKVTKETAKAITRQHFSAERVGSSRTINLSRFNRLAEVIDTLPSGCAVPLGRNGIVELAKDESLDGPNGDEMAQKIAKENIKLAGL